MRRKFRCQQGFTLIEILAVLTLLGFILTLVGNNIIKNMQKGQVKAARAQIESLESALESYYLDNATYPTTEQGLRALIELPDLPPVPENWDGPYLKDKSLPKDPWGHELKYFCPGIRNPDSYDLYSLGKDNREGGTGDNADIGNW